MKQESLIQEEKEENKGDLIKPCIWILNSVVTITHTVYVSCILFKKENLSSSDNILDICTLTADTHIINLI